MSYQKYCELVDEIYKRAKVSDQEKTYEECSFTLLNVAFTVAYGDKEDADRFLLFCDFGEPPELNTAIVLSRVLEQNIEMFAQDAGHFAINPETGHILLMSKLPLENIEMDSFFAMLFMQVELVNQWQYSYNFYDDPSDRESTLSPDLFGDILPSASPN